MPQNPCSLRLGNIHCLYQLLGIQSEFKSSHVNKRQRNIVNSTFVFCFFLLWRNYHWSSMSFGMCRNTYTFHDICDRFIKKNKNKKKHPSLIPPHPAWKMQSGRNITSAHFHDLWAESSVSVRCFFSPLSLKEAVWQLRLFFTASLTLSQEETRHILVNHESDAAGGSDADHVGDDAFVEAGGAFVPASRGGRRMTQEGLFFSFYF